MVKITEVSLNHNLESLGHMLPELFLIGTILLIVLLDLIISNRKTALFVSTNLFLFASIALIVFGVQYSLQCECNGVQNLFEIGELKSPSIVNTKLGAFFKALMGLCGVLLVVFNQLDFKKSSAYEQKSEYYIAVLSILLGACLMVGATHFLVLLIAIEISSFGAYALIYFNDTKKAKEAALKYILYGLMATGIMLFGISLVYMELGTLSYTAVLDPFIGQLRDATSLILDKGPIQINEITNYSDADFVFPYFLATGLLLLLVGFMFKLATVPMHIWVPDAFEGGPTSGIAFLSLVPKFGALANLILLFSTIHVFTIDVISIQQILMILGVVTLSVGNFFALGQHNIKRLLGYSSIAHSGFLLIALSVFGLSGLNSLLFYTLVYVFMNFAVFMLAEFFIDRTGSEDLRKWAGAGSKLSFMSVLMVVVLIALIGLPPTAGFSAKLFVFAALIENYDATGDKILLITLIVAAFNIVISLFYYLKIPYYLFFQQSDDLRLIKSSLLSKLQMILVVLPLVVLFIFSEKALNLIQQVNYIVNYLLQ